MWNVKKKTQYKKKITALNNASPACTDVWLISVQDIHICFLLNYKTAFKKI